MLTGHGNMGMRAEQAGVGTEKEGGGWYTSGGDEGVGDERGREGGVRVADLQTESGWGGGEPRDYDVDWRHDGGVGDGVEITAGWFSGVVQRGVCFNGASVGGVESTGLRAWNGKWWRLSCWVCGTSMGGLFCMTVCILGRR